MPQAGMHDGIKMPNARPKCASIGLTARYRAVPPWNSAIGKQAGEPLAAVSIFSCHS